MSCYSVTKGGGERPCVLYTQVKTLLSYLSTLISLLLTLERLVTNTVSTDNIDMIDKTSSLQRYISLYAHVFTRYGSEE